MSLILCQSQQALLSHKTWQGCWRSGLQLGLRDDKMRAVASLSASWPCLAQMTSLLAKAGVILLHLLPQLQSATNALSQSHDWTP